MTASSEVSSAGTPAGHVQIGDPYTQKNMHDFLLEARDQGLITFITDCGGGGLSSAVGESAQMAGGGEVWLEAIPLKYQGLDPWEIWVSESQERMVVGVKPEHEASFKGLARKHAVEATVIGRYTDSGVLEVKYQGRTCAYMDLSFLEEEFPPWEFEAEWLPPETRLTEPVLGEPGDHLGVLLALLDRPNICSREWITRQYDHEVQGASVIKPLVGEFTPVPGDAAVLRPRPDSHRGLALSLALCPAYSQIDTYHMTAVTIDEAVRRLLAVGGSLDHIGGVDNFCWPSVEYDPARQPRRALQGGPTGAVLPGPQGPVPGLRRAAVVGQGQHVCGWPDTRGLRGDAPGERPAHPVFYRGERPAGSAAGPEPGVEAARGLSFIWWATPGPSWAARNFMRCWAMWD